MRFEEESRKLEFQPSVIGMQMKTYQKIAAIVLVLLLGVTIVGLRRTGNATRTATPTGKNKHAADNVLLVDETPLKTAQQLAQQASTPEELELAKDALRVVNRELDLAYDAARHELKEHPPALNADAKEAKDRLEKAQKLLIAYQAQLDRLNDAVAKEKNPDKKDDLTELRDDAEADRDLAQDELDDAKEDFQRAGGDLDQRLQDAQQQHKQALQSTQALPVNPPAPPAQFGLIHQYKSWMALHSTQMQLWRAKQDADNAAASLTAKHNQLDAQLETEKEKTPELSGHAKKKKAAPQTGTAGQPDAATAKPNTQDIAALADRKWQLAARQEALSTYDKRIDSFKDLSDLYGQWIGSVAARQRVVVHQALIGVLIILVIGLAGVFFATLLDNVLGRLKMDRRQVQSLHTVAHVTVRVVAVLLILLVIFGPPGQLGTFLGLATAGLTVGLKDFIVGFIGWFVLMGKNGIRLGDWVEINGVTGEVVEIGPFHTVLLETGNWTDSGHPTGRRVTFTNSFAIEGHYFNFSTTGQWLWDELTVVMPAGKENYAIVDAIRKKVEDETRESGEMAEQEWRRATNSREMSGFSAKPAISIKPVLGGVEMSVRYITRAHERYALRAKLNHAAVRLLGGPEESWPATQ